MRQWIAAVEAELDRERALERLLGSATGRSPAPAPAPAPAPKRTTHRGPGRQAVAWDRARARAQDSAGQPLPGVTRELDAALGHALAGPLTALTDLPPFDTSAMGGGARVQTGASAVLRGEHGDVGADDGLLGDRSGNPGAGGPGRDVRMRGQECRAGEVLLPAGTAVTPAVVGLAAAAGHDRLLVHRRPRVELLILGDELPESGPPRGGRVRDALGPLLPPWLARHGAEVICRRPVADDPGRLRDALRGSTADVVVTTGSTAAGAVDPLHAVLAESGARLLVDSVAVRPGHPMLLAELPPPPDGRPRLLVGLPGHPLAAVAGAVTLAVPLLRRLGGHADRDPESYRTTTASALPGHPHDTRLLPVRRVTHGILPLPFDGPAMLRGLAVADGLAVVPPGGVPAGADVEVLDVPGP
ncbi:molybdopterin molybdenumtransferase MoeA [Streptomyces venezuelae]|uniref:Molybdopterin molybdenumtransferase n=1 Tax=Streptomyces venezuelae TaxID=54571 RepID=A0A5P2B5X8_STRVZ|nr:molybdopterin molybdenumtransferase MoeA [Streptomyces venezuelae]